MIKEPKKSLLQEMFKLKPPRKRKSLSSSEKILLKEHTNRYLDALKRGEDALKSENRAFGRSELPGEKEGR